jgi:prepilin-type N-terminal cleavage/methylation domain-containing protein
MKRRGFSLFEALVALLILSIMFVALLSLYSEGQRQFINENAQADVLEESRFPMAWIARDAKMATAVATSYSTYTTSANTLVLAVPSIDSSGLIIDVALHSDYIVYHIGNEMLQRIVYPKSGVSSRASSSRYLGYKVTSLTFTYYDSSDNTLSSNFATAASLNASVTAQRRGVYAVNTYQETMNSKFKLRNK